MVIVSIHTTRLRRGPQLFAPLRGAIAVYRNRTDAREILCLDFSCVRGDDLRRTVKEHCPELQETVVVADATPEDYLITIKTTLGSGERELVVVYNENSEQSAAIVAELAKRFDVSKVTI